MSLHISNTGAALAVLHGQMENEKIRLLKLRKEQQRIAREMLVSQRHMAACLDTMNKLINNECHVYTAADL